MSEIRTNSAQLKYMTKHGEQCLTLDQLCQELVASRSLLLTGFQQSSLETTRAGILLAEQLQAYCDPWLTPEERLWQTSWTREAWATCTWGEVIERADFILCWNAQYPAHHLTCFNHELIHTKQQVLWSIQHDQATIQTPHAQTLTLSYEQQLLLLRMLKAESSAAALPNIKALQERLATAHYPVIIWGSHWAGADPYLSRELIQAQLRWVRHASLASRLHHLALRSNPGVLNFASAANWLTGHNGGLQFRLNQIVADPQQNAALRLIQDSEVDAVCWIGELDQAITAEILQHNLKLFQITHPGSTYESGTYLRDDGVPIHISAEINQTSQALYTLRQQLGQNVNIYTHQRRAGGVNPL